MNQCDHTKTSKNTDESFIICENCGLCLGKVIIPSWEDKRNASQDSNYIIKTKLNNNGAWWRKNPYKDRRNLKILILYRNLYRIFNLKNGQGNDEFVNHVKYYQSIEKQLKPKDQKRYNYKPLVYALFFLFIREFRAITIDNFVKTIDNNVQLRINYKNIRSLVMKVDGLTNNNAERLHNGNNWKQARLFLQKFIDKNTIPLLQEELYEIKKKFEILRSNPNLCSTTNITLIHASIYIHLRQKYGEKRKIFCKNGVSPNYVKIIKTAELSVRKRLHDN